MLAKYQVLEFLEQGRNEQEALRRRVTEAEQLFIFYCLIIIGSATELGR